MIFSITRTSDICGENDYSKDIKNLDELIGFMKEVENPLILLDCNDENGSIEIYDYYRE